jgi:hypothetical protein
VKPTLESARLKLERSRELLEELQTEHDTWGERLDLQFADKPPIYEQLEQHEDGPWVVVRCDDRTPVPPLRWALLVGDAMHNARTALDHLACRLVEHADKKIDRATAFPIRRHEPKTAREIATFDAAIKGMSDPHKDSIRKLQPYANPGTVEARRLLTLAGMDNADKHVLLVPIQSALMTPEPVPTDAPYRWNTGVPLAPGVEVFRYRPGIQANVYPNVGLTFGEKHKIGLGEFPEIRAYVVGIVESFDPEFS